MRIAHDLNASRRIFTAIKPRRASELRAQLVHGALLIALSSGCSAITDFGDFEFGPKNGETRDSGAQDSGERDSGPNQPDKDGGGSGSGGDKDSSVVEGDAAVSGDAGDDAATNPEDGGGGDPDAGGGDGGQDSGTSCPSQSEICDNNQDDDCDGRTDCSDTDCAGLLSCCSALPENSQSLCSDNRDNDCNGKTDCTDPACGATAACCTSSGSENDVTACADGIDNDCDGKFDCADAQCAGIGSCCAVVIQTPDLGGGTGCCVPDGQNEADQPNDGKDNDCDGLTDIPVLLSAFPVQGLPASAQEVKLRFMTEMDPNATLQCSTRRIGQAPVWGACPMSGLDIKPFDAVASANAMNNGVWTTQVRWSFMNGARSAVYTFRYYVHHTLHNVNHCTQLHTDKQFFDKAIERLGVKDTNTVFKLGVDTFLLSPFIQVKYEVPVSGNSALMLNGEKPDVKMWSLRRRFTVHSSNKYLLITRNYTATRWPGSCNAASFRIHNSNHEFDRNRFRTYSCQAVVMNRAGIGVCLDNGASMIAGPKLDNTKDSHAPFGDPLSFWPYANKFMWRQMLEKERNFTRKCAVSGCTGTYLPDRSQFSP